MRFVSGPGVPPPIVITLASGSSSDVEWYRRMRVAVGPVLHVPVPAGLKISVVYATPVAALLTALPPETSTRPSAITVALPQCRPNWACGSAVTCGIAPLILITLALREAALDDPPPTWRIRPGANITAVDDPPALSVGKLPSVAIVPVPAGLMRRIALLARLKTSPSGATKFLGYPLDSELVDAPVSSRN